MLIENTEKKKRKVEIYSGFLNDRPIFMGVYAYYCFHYLIHVSSCFECLRRKKKGT